MSSPPKITAEWIVRAQLTIRKSNGNQPRPNNELDSIATVERLVDTDNPMKVTYKWCTQEPLIEHLPTPSHTNSSTSSNKDGALGSSGVASSDSGISSTTTKINTLPATSIDHQNSSKFQSSCNIILTACTNILPEHSEYAEDLSTTFYTIFPDSETTLKSNVPMGGAFGVKDAFCQTNDTELVAKQTLETEHLYEVC